MAAKKTEVRVNERGKYEYAYMLYLQKIPQKDICEKVGVSSNTISRWKADNGWEVKRASKEISTDMLVAKAMTKINELLDSENFSADSFAKAVAQLKTLKKDPTVDDAINILSKFGDWLIEKSQTDKAITTEIVKAVTQMQDKYILTLIKNG